MGKLGRRDFLRAAVATTGGVVVSGALEGLLASAAGAAKPSSTLAPVPDLRDGAVRLWLPSGFQYRSFHDTEFMVTLDDGTALPGRHDGMAAFAGPGGNVWLVRNHEVNNPGTPFGPGTPYDSAGRGGTTTTLVTPFGEVVQGFTSLNGTQMNCSGGRMPWGSWITCEETVNGPDVGPDFTNTSNVPLQQRHGFIFEVPAGGAVEPSADHLCRPLRARGGGVRPAGGGRLPHGGQLRFPLRHVPLPTWGEPDGDREPRERWSPADAPCGRCHERPPRGDADPGRDLCGRLGRHRRPGTDVSVHTRRAGVDDEQRCPQLRRQPGPRPGCGALLPPRRSDVHEDRSSSARHRVGGRPRRGPTR